MTDEFELVGLPEEENDFVQLAFFGFRGRRDRDGDPGMDGHGIHRPHFGGARVRHVRTPEGAQYYDQPIGSIITKDTINRVNREKGRLGLKPPKGALTAAQHPQDHGHPALHQMGMPNADHTTVAPPHTAPSTPHGKGPVTPAQAAVRAKLQANSPKPGALARRLPGSVPSGPKAPGSSAIHTPAGHKPAANLEQEVKQIKPTINGPLKFSVGGKEFGAPEGSSVYHLKQNPDALAFVRTNDGTVHVFNHNGEVTVPPSVQPILQKRFASKLKQDDPNYLAGKFNNEGKVPQLSEAKPGAELHDKSGPQFQQQPDGSWQHTGLGTKHDTSELDPHYKSGELEYKPAGGADLSSMDQAGFKQAVRKQTSLQFANPKTGEVHDLTRGEDKLWHSTDKNQAPLSDNSLYYLRKNLSISDNPEMAKEVRKATKEAAKPAGAKRPAARKPKAETPKVETPKTPRARKPKAEADKPKAEVKTPRPAKPKEAGVKTGAAAGSPTATRDSKTGKVEEKLPDAKPYTPSAKRETKKPESEGRYLPRESKHKDEPAAPKEEPKAPRARKPKTEEPKTEAPKTEAPKAAREPIPVTPTPEPQPQGPHKVQARDLEPGDHIGSGTIISVAQSATHANKVVVKYKDFNGVEKQGHWGKYTDITVHGSHDESRLPAPKKMAELQRGDVIHPHQVSHLPAGSVVKEHFQSGHERLHERQSPHSWKNHDGSQPNMSTANSVLEKAAKHGRLTFHAHPKTEEHHAPEAPKAEEHHAPAAPAAEQPAPDHFPDGHVFGHHSELAQLEPGRHITASVPTPSGSAAYLPDRHYVKHEDGLFHSTDHSEIPPKTAEQIKHAHSAWDHWKVTLDPKHADAQRTEAPHPEPPHAEPPHAEAPQAAEPHVEAPHAPEAHAPEAPHVQEPHVEAPAAHEAPAAEKPPFHILPEGERGLSGDGHPHPGLWGNYGAAGVMIRHKDENGQEKFLLVQRGQHLSNAGKWQLPGGAIDQHENPYQGTARETHEELGASHEYLASLKPVGEHVFEHATGWKYTNIAADAPAKFEPQVDHTETADAKWYTRDELQKLKEDGHLNPPFAAAIDHILGKFKNDEPHAAETPKTEAPAHDPAAAAQGLTHRPHMPADAGKVKIDQPIDTSSWTKEQDSHLPHGSNPGGYYTDGNGDRWYVKQSQSDDHARNEALASALYRAAGIDVPEVRLAHVQGSDGTLGVASRIVPGAQQDLHSHLNDAEYLKKIHEGFATDAWLANWDVAGLNFDNIVTGEDGKPHRIDTGGTLLYRATGPAKGAAFAHTAGELSTFKDPYMSEQGHRLFQGMTPEAEKASAQRVANVKPTEINRLVDESGFSGAKAEELKTKLAARREHIMQTYGVTPREPRPQAPAAPSEPTPTPSPAPAHAASSGELQPGDKIPHAQWLSDAAGGSQIHYHKNDGSTTLYTKHPTQDHWISPNGTAVRSNSLGQPSRLSKLTFHSKPEQAPEAHSAPTTPPENLAAPEHVQREHIPTPAEPVHVPEAHAPEPVTTPAPAPHSSMNPDDVIGLPGVGDPNNAPDFRVEEIQAAITALENHPHQAIKYGFKKIPDNPLVAHAEDLTKVAKQAYPDLKPKQAVIAHLKHAIGIPVGDSNPAAVARNAIKVSLPQKDGAKEVTLQDLQGAVTALEAAPGVQVKAILAKVGNPLANLDQHHLLGFIKDKKEQKAKYIDFLKKKIEEASSSGQGEALPQLPDHIHGDKLTGEHLRTLKPGEQITRDSGMFRHHYTKQADGSFKHNSHGNVWSQGTMAMAADQGKVTYHDPAHRPSEPPVAAAPVAPAGPQPGQIVASRTELHAAAAGQTFHMHNPTAPDLHYDMVKNEDGSLSHPDYGSIQPGHLGDHAIDAGWLTHGTHEDMSAAQQQTFAPGHKFRMSDVHAFEQLPAGEVVHFHDNSADQGSQSDYISNGDGTFHLEGTSNDFPVHSSSFGPAIGNGWLTMGRHEDHAASIAGEAQPNEGETVSAEQIKAMVPGDKIKIEGSQYHYTKTENGGSWLSSGSGAYHSENTILNTQHDYNFLYAGKEPNPTQHEAVTAAEHSNPLEAPTTNASGITPGKWSTNEKAKAYMVVKGDGSGIYVNSHGEAKAITAAKVKSLHEHGMQHFHGQVSDYPRPGAAEQVAAGAAKKPATVEKLPDGIYFNGIGPNATMYAVHGDKVRIHTNGSTGTEKNLSFLKTKFMKGEILDKHGNSVLPKDSNYGSAQLFGGHTTVPELAQLRDELNKIPEGGATDFFQKIKDKYDAEHTGWSPISSLNGHLSAYLSEHGVTVDNVTLTNRSNELHGNSSVESKVATLKAQLTPMLAGVNHTPIEENAAKHHFTFDATGRATLPESLTLAGYNNEPWDVSSINDLIKQHADGFGGGGVIGQHMTKLDKTAKRAWLKAFNRGDFKTMFSLEQRSASHAGKGMPNPTAHPGHAANAATHKVEWGAPVLGEVPAGEVVPGNWSGLGLNASQEELANYLIASKMQHPTFLSLEERRNWVKAHRQGLHWDANLLSLRAKRRADNGDQPLSSEPTWTDNLQPAKSYDHLFDSTPFPQNWTTTLAKDWVHDQVGKPEFRDIIHNYAEEIKNNQGATYATTAEHLMLSDPTTAIDAARAKAIAKSWFQKKQQEWAIEDAIPKYSLDPAHQLAGNGSHALAIVDHHGKQYVFKPSPDGSDYRPQLEHGANEIGRAFGFPTAVSKVAEFNGQKGLMQDRHSSVSDLTGFNDVSTLTPPQLRAITQEHLLDYLLNNDNSRAKHFLINQDGGIHGIDKSRAFHYGMQEGTLDHFGLPHGAVHEKIYEAIRSGKIDKATADNLYLAMRERAARMEKAPNDPFSTLLDDALKNREQSHFGDFSSAEVKKRFFDRKQNLVGEVDSMWRKIYKDAGHGALPEPPKHPLGEHHSGVHDERWHAKIHESHGLGATTHISTPGVLDGHVIGYSTQNADGTRNTHAKFHIAGEHADRVTGHLETLAPGSSGPVDNTVLPSQYSWRQAMRNAALNHNYQTAQGLTIEPGHEAAFRHAWDAVKGDQTFLAQNSPTDTIIHMPSGNNVEKQYLDHYKALLSHWAERGQKLDDAIKNKVWIDESGTFQPYKSHGTAPNEETYTNAGLGQKYVALNNDKYLHIDNGKVKQVSAHELSQEILTGQNGWIKDAKATPPSSSWYDVKRVPAFQLEGHLAQDGEIKLNGHKVLGEDKGYPGDMWEIKLPGGALLHYQNRGATDTTWVQHNTFRVTMPNTHQSSDISKHMQEVDKFLTEMGLPLQEADHRHVEASYWRKMANIFLHQNREKTHDPAKKAAYESVHQDLMQEVRKHGFDSLMKDEHGYNSAYQASAHEYLHDMPGASQYNSEDTLRRFDIPTMLAEKFPGVDEEVAFYRQLFGKAFGQKIVDNWVHSESYMPHYHEYIQGGKAIKAGLPYHERFDVNPADLQKHKKYLAHSFKGYGQELMNRLESLGHSGALLSTEARLRVLGEWFGGQSSQEDQSYSSAHGVYTNIESLPTYTTHQHLWFDAAPFMSRVETYSYPGDIFGSFHHKDWAPIDPEYALKHFTNETMVYDGVPVQQASFIALQSQSEVDHLIAALKRSGITELNGLPLDEAVVTGTKLTALLQKLHNGGH